jgi:hypothetical protein
MNSNIFILEPEELVNVNGASSPFAVTLIGVTVDAGVPPFTDRLAEPADPLTASVVKKEPDVKGLNAVFTVVLMLLLVCTLLPAIIRGVFALVIFTA